MKKLIFDLQRFDATVEVKFKYADGVVTGYTETTPDGGGDVETSADLFTISGLKSADDLTGAISGDTYTVTVANDAASLNKGTVSIAAKDSTDGKNYALSYSVTTAPTYAWTGTDGSKVAEYKRAAGYSLNSDGDIVYTASDTKVKLTFTSTVATISDLANYLEVDKAGAEGKITVTKHSGNILANGFSITSGNYTIALDTEEVGGKDQPIGKFTATATNLTQSGSTVTVTGTWTAGYWLDSTNKKLNYAAATNETDANKKVTLATIKGVTTDDLDLTAVTGKDIEVNNSTGQITLKAKDLNQKTVTITETKAPDSKTTGNYTFTLAGDVSKSTTETATVEGKEVTTTTIPDDKDIWELNAAKTQATYKNVTPAYYTVATTDAKSVTYTAQKTNATHGVIKGLNIANKAGTATDMALADDGTGKLKLTYKDSSGADKTVAEAIAVKAPEAGKTDYTFTLKTPLILPITAGSITLGSAPEGSKIKLDSAAISGQTAEKHANTKWSFASGVATFKAKLTNGYTEVNDNDTTIKSFAAENEKELVTINGLSSDVKVTDAELANYISVEGFNAETAPAGADTGTLNVAAFGSAGDGKITIKLKKAALTNKAVTLTNKNAAFQYALAFADDVTTTGEDDTKDGVQAGTADGTPPTAENIWVFNGTTAIFKQVIPEYWTLDNGKVTYHKQTDVQTYATIKGLKESTVTALKARYQWTKTATTGAVTTSEDDGNGGTTTTTYLNVDANGKITLNANMLNATNVTLTNGKDYTYTLDINTTDAAYKVDTPDIKAKWWTLADDGAGTQTAQLHQTTSAGYKVDNNGLAVKYYAADTAGKLLAEVKGLSSDVKALKADGTAVAANANDDAKKLGVALGIENATTPASSVIAHQTYKGTIAAADLDNLTKYTFETEDLDLESGKQNITLTDAMLGNKKVTLADKNTKDDDEFKLKLATTGDIPATTPAAANSWAIGGTDANNVTLTYQSYDKGYYSEAEGANAGKLINYTKEGAKTKLFTLTVKNANRVTGKYRNADGVVIDGETVDGVLQVEKAAVEPATDPTWEDFVTVDDGAQTVNVTANAASTVSGNSIAFKANSTDYSDYKLVNNTSSSVEYGNPTWTVEGTTATLKIGPSGDDKKGYELSGDEKTLTYISANTDLLKLTGLKSGASLTATDYDAATKTVTLKKDMLTTTKVQLASLNKDDYTLALDGEVPQEAGVEGYTWTVSDGTGGQKNVVAKQVEQAYYSNTNLTTIAYYKPVVKATLFTINGLNASYTPEVGAAITLATVEDNDAADFSLTNTPAGGSQTEYITFDEGSKEVTVKSDWLPTDATKPVTLKGTGWKFANVTEPEFTGTATWDDTNKASGSVTLKMTPTNGYKITNNGQKLTYVTGVQTLFTITGLKADYNKTLLADAYDPATNTVTLPKEVLGETATKIKLTPDSTSVFKGDTYTLALADDVATATTVANAWVKDSNNNLVFKSVGATGYFSSDTATSFTYHKESGAQTVFTLQNNGLLDSDTYAAAILTDKDGDAVLTKADGTTLISVNTATDSYKVSLNEAAFVATGSSSGEKNGGYDEYVTLKNGSGKSYTLELGDISAPVYNDGTWTETAAHSTTYTLTRKATSGGYELSDSNRKLTYVATNDTETALQVSGIASDSTLTEDSNIDFDGTNNSVTILKKELLNPTKIALKSLDGGTYTLALGEDIRQTAEDAAGYIWKLTDGKIEAKYGTRTYYSSDTSGTSFTYHAEKPSDSLFTIAYTGKPAALYRGTPIAFTAFTDDDGDNILNNGDNQYLSFATNGTDLTKGTVTVLDEENILPKGNGNTFKISNGDYKFENNVTTPLYDDSAATWAKGTDTTAVLSIKPGSAGYNLTHSDTTLTYVAAQSETLATLSGLASGFSETSLQSGAEVDVAAKTITLSEDVLKNRSGNKLSVNNGYSLAIDPSADVQIGSDSATTNIWQLGTNDNTKAYYRTVQPEYYTVSGNTITYNAPVQSGNDLLAISGLKAGTTAVEGEITGISINETADTDGKYVVSIASTNLGTDTAEITTGSATYKFELTSGAATRSRSSWSYATDTGIITLKGTYGSDSYITSANGQSIIYTTGASSEQTLATISGVASGLSITPANKFDVDYDSRVITFKDDSLLKDATTISISGDFFNYGLGLDTSEINTATDTGGTTWTFTPDGSTATYKTITEAYYTLATDTKSITTTAQSSNTAIVIVTGLNVDTDTYEWSASTESNAYSLKVKTNKTGTATNDAISFDAATSEVTLKDAVLPTGAAAATVSVSAAGTLAFDIGSTAKQEAEFSAYKANQAADDNVFNITATRAAFYTLNDDKNQIAFTPESAAFLVASLSGIKAVDTALNDNIANANTPYNYIKVDTDNKEITVSAEALAHSDVTLTTTQGYKLVLDDDVNTSTDAKDTWTFDSGSATYKNNVAEHYALTNGTSIKRTAESDTKTYFTITGLKNTNVAADKLTAGTDAYGDSIIRKGSGTTSVVEFDGNDTITLSRAALPDEGTVQITKDRSNSADTTYKLALADDVSGDNLSTKGTPALGITSTSRGAAVITLDATWSAGYKLSASDTKVVKIAANTEKDTLVTINNLNIPTNTAVENLSSYITYSNGTFTIKPGALGTSKVELTDTDPDNEYTIELDAAVQTTADSTSYWTPLSNGRSSYCTGAPPYYTVAADGQSVAYTAAGTAKTILTLNGLANTTGIDVDEDEKTVTIPVSALGTSNVTFTSNTDGYTMELKDYTEPSSNKTWKVSGTTATLQEIPTDKKYTLSSDGKTITCTAANSATDILRITGLKSGLEPANTAGTGVVTANSITGITLAEDEGTITATIDDDVMTNTNVSISGSSDYTFKLARGADVPSSAGDDKGWSYKKSGNTLTFNYVKNDAAYYSLANNDTQLKYNPATSNTTYITISGTGFSSAITTAITAYEAADDDGKAAAETAWKEALAKYVTVADSTAGSEKVTIKSDGTGDAQTYLIDKTDDTKFVTVTTNKVGITQYELEIANADVVKTTGDTKKWSLKGSSLILSTPLSAGYTLNGNKLSYAGANSGGDKIFTINGLDLTDAKKAMDNLTDDQKTAAASAATTAALEEFKTANTSKGLNLTTEELTALSTAPTQPVRASYEDSTAYSRANRIYNAYNSVYSTKYNEEVAKKKEDNLNTYLNTTNPTYITINGTDVNIKQAMLGESNVTITNNGDVDYKLKLGNGVTTYADDDAADGDKANVWSLSGSTATYRMTTPAYYTYDSDKNQIEYHKAKLGAIAATVRGLNTSRVVGTGLNTTSTEDTETEGQTTTTKTDVYHTDTQITEINDAGEIGGKTVRKTRTVITTTVSHEEEGKADEVTTSETVAETTQTAFAKGVTADVSDTDHKKIKLKQNVLGTTAVTLTNGTDSEFALEFDGTVQGPDEIFDENLGDKRKWSSSLGGTTANLTADFQEGWTLDNNKITYTAAKTDANILTLNGIKVNLSATDPAVTSAITAAKEALATELGLVDENDDPVVDNLTAAQVRAATTTGTNNAINKWLTTDQNVVVATAAQADGEDDEGKYLVTIKNAALNNANITVKSGDNTKVYKLKLAGDVKATKAASETASYAWNGLKYQSSNAAYYAENTSNGITFNKANNVVTLATLKGIVGSSITAGAWTASAGSEGAGILKLDHTMLGTTNVSLTGTGADKVTLQLDSNDTALKTSASAAKRNETNGLWAISGTTATKKDGWNPYYTLADNKVIYHADSGTTKTFATIRGLKSGVKAISESSGTVTLTENMLGTSNITITKGNATIDALTYKLKLDDGIDAPELSNKGWNTSGVNTTLKADVAAGWNLDSASTTAIYTASATNKALATFILGTAGLATTTEVELATNNVLTLSNIGDNKMITIKTNPGNLSFNITDGNFSGTAADARTTLVGSSVGEGINVTGKHQIISGLGGDDNIVLSAAEGASVNGGVGADRINIGSTAQAVTIYGDAANDTIEGSTTNGNNIFYGGAGDDSISLAAVNGTVTILGETGNDEINVGDATGGLFNGGAGADKITLDSASAVSIYGEAANDEIKVTNDATNSTIWGGAGMDSISIGGALTGGTILGEAGNDEIYVNGTATNATIDGGAGSDIITLAGAMTGGLILGDVGNDTIKVAGAASGTINGGAGNDSIVVGNNANGLVVYGGAGNDEVALGDGTVTFYYVNGDGNDTVTGYGDGNKSFAINSGEISSASLSGGDMILKIGSYKVTLKDYKASGYFSYTSGGASKTISIADASSDLIYDTSGLLADDNFMTPNDISDLVKTNSVTEYHVGNYNNNLMAPDQILSEGDLISYGDDKKNK